MVRRLVYLASIRQYLIHFDGGDQKNAILAPLIDCHDLDKTVSREPNIRSAFFQ